MEGKGSVRDGLTSGIWAPFGEISHRGMKNEKSKQLRH